MSRADASSLTPTQRDQANRTRRLDLSRQRLAAIPDEVLALHNIQELILYDNQITSVPPTIGTLHGLERLVLQGNRLPTLPPEISSLTGLRILLLGDNRLRTLPESFSSLENVVELRLGDNQFTNVPPSVFHMVALTNLDLSHNQIHSVPSELQSLTNLVRLDLSSNMLVSVPPDIGTLPRLKDIDLSGNLLTSVPASLAGPLRRGLKLNLSNNPLREPLPELIARGADALATYLDSLEGAVPQYEAKMVLVGEGNVGKTSLVAAIKGEQFQSGRPTTHGIEISRLAFRHPFSDDPITIYAWDFGGQEVYRVTHQFFYSRRALYLVVWNARDGQDQNEVEGWLRRIHLRLGPDAHVLIVATNSDERRPELNYPFLQQMFPGMLKGRFAVDNSSGNGVERLSDAIAEEASRLPQMGQLLSSRWLAARNEVLLRSANEPQIRYEEFVDVCGRHHLTEEEAATLADLLHDLGQIIYYGDDPSLRDVVVLDPEWLVKAIAYVLDDGPTNEANGVLDHARLKDIWAVEAERPSYANFRPYFLRLMEKFDVSYRVEGDESSSLVAQLVPYEQPQLDWTAATPVARPSVSVSVR